MPTVLERTIKDLGPEGVLALDLTDATMPRVGAFKAIHGIKSERETIGAGMMTINGQRQRHSDVPTVVRTTFCNKHYHYAKNPGDSVARHQWNVSKPLPVPDPLHPVTCLNCLKLIRGLREEQARLRGEQAHPLNKKTATVFMVNSAAVEQAIKAAYDVPNYEFAWSEETTNGTYKVFKVDAKEPSDFTRLDIDRFIEKRGNMIGMAWTMLDDMCRRGLIQPGTYVVDCGW